PSVSCRASLPTTRVTEGRYEPVVQAVSKSAPGTALWHVPDRNPGRGRTESGVDVRRESGDAAQVAVLLCVVEPVPDDELVRQLQADVLYRDRHIGRVRLHERGEELDRGRLA